MRALKANTVIHNKQFQLFVSPVTMRLRAQKYKKDYCERCGANAHQLLVHHRDGDVYNNSSENLQTLCESCHRRIHLART